MRWFWKKRDVDREIEEELAYHRAMLAKEAGDPSAARKLGNATQIHESVRAVWIWTWLETLLLDLRFAVRQLRKRPVLVAVAALSLALGIGANTAIFTVINSILLESLPVRDPGRLVLFNDDVATGVYSGDQPAADEFSYPFWRSITGKIQAFDGLCAFRQGIDRATLHMAEAKNSNSREQTSVHLVSGNYFQVLGVTAERGRLLEPDDDRRNAAAVAVISDAYWRERFASDPAVIGKTAILNGTAFTIIGVTEPEFFGERVGQAPDFFLPLCWQPEALLQQSWLDSRHEYWLNMMGRLTAGATRQQAENEVTLRLREYWRSIAGASPSKQRLREIASIRVNLKPGGGGISFLRFIYSQPLHLLMGAVALVLLIACANVAILFMARTVARTQEFLARISLGASRSRVIRQVLAETVLLSIISGLLAVGVAWGLVKGLVALLGIPAMVHIKPDTAVLTFTAAVSVATGILFGLVPAIRCGRIQPRAGTAVRSLEFGMQRFGMMRLMIAGQMALSLVLLFGAALLAHSLSDLETQNLGFQSKHILIVQTDPRLAGYKPSELLPFYQQLDARLNAIPGVISAAVARYTPVDGSDSSSNGSIEGYTPKTGVNTKIYDLEVGPHFFQTLHIPILRGRGIEPTDTPASPPVAVVSQAFANTFLPNMNPIGRRLSLGSPFNPPGFEIVGVAGDTHFYDVREVQPMVFFSAWQGKAVDPYSGALLFDVAGDPATIVPKVRKVLASIDSRLPVHGITRLDKQIQHSYKTQTIITELCSLFGVLALLLAAIGLYGSSAYLVSRRINELGIRMALGAQRSAVLWMVLRQALMVTGLGLLIGIPFAFAATRLVRAYLYGVTMFDPAAVIATLAVIAIAGILAGYLPARRATNIDPIIALRYE